MSHAENPVSDSANQPRTFEFLTAAPVRTRRKPRDWPDEEKERLIAETLLPRANVSAIALAEGLDRSRLYGWRRKALSSGMVAPVMEAAREEVKFVRIKPVASSTVEIVIGDVVVCVVVYVSCLPVDFCKGAAASLMALVRDGGLDPFNGALYLFRTVFASSGGMACIFPFWVV